MHLEQTLTQLLNIKTSVIQRIVYDDKSIQ